MDVLLCLNAIGFSDYGRQALAGGRSCVDLLAASLARLEGVSGALVLCGPDGGETGAWIAERLRAALAGVPVEVAALPDRSGAAALRALAERARPEQAVLLAAADAPLLHAGLAATLLANHAAYHAEYSFADGFPLGMAAEVVKPSILPVLAGFAADKGLAFDRPDALFEIVKVDINAFEIETEIAPRDLRLLRIDLHCDSRRNRLLCAALLPVFERHGDDLEALLAAIESDQGPLRTLPAYFNVQLSGGCPQACSYCPWPRRVPVLHNREFMPAARFLELCRGIRDFSPESVVSLSLWGEPALHPEIMAILDATADLAPLRFQVETSGLGWDAAALEAFAAGGRHGNIDWIVSLDAMDPAAYRAMRGEGAAEALAAAHRFVALFGKRAYVQAVRCDLNDPVLQAHYQYWKQAGASQIIQKYDHFCGALEDRRLADIAPLDRQACWHLKRDMNILIDGRVPRCREDLGASDCFGNVFSDGLAAVWEAMGARYREQLGGSYRDICGACDEYYTFNN